MRFVYVSLEWWPGDCVGRQDTYQEHAADVQHEGDAGVQDQHEPTCLLQVGVVKCAPLRCEGDDQVEESADRGVIIQANKGVHLLPVAREEDLDQYKPHRLEDDASDLEQETGPAEMNLAEAGEGNTGYDTQDVEDAAHIGMFDTPRPGGKQNRNGSGGLEHLNEGDAQVHVGEVAADETGTVKKADGHNGAQVKTTGHFNLVASIDELGSPGQDLGGDRREHKMPTCKYHGYRRFVSITKNQRTWSNGPTTDRDSWGLPTIFYGTCQQIVIYYQEEREGRGSY